MKKIYFVICLLLTYQSVFGQENISKEELKRQIAEGNALIISQIKWNSVTDSDAIEYIKTLASDELNRQKNGSASYFAQVALAKMNNASALDQIREECKIDNPQYLVGMEKVFQVGGRFALKTFYSLLHDETQVHIDGVKDVIYYPKNAMAIYYLSKMVERPPTRRGVPSNNIPAWKKWFEEHKHLID